MPAETTVKRTFVALALLGIIRIVGAQGATAVTEAQARDWAAYAVTKSNSDPKTLTIFS